MNCSDAKHILIDDYLRIQGYHCVRRSASGRMYYSILAPSGEHTPSFEVSSDGHAFHDWSTGSSGSIIDLVMHKLGTNDVSVCLKHLSDTMGTGFQPAENKNYSFSFHPQKNYHSIEIISTSAVESPALIQYAQSRHIPSYILREYCCQINYSVRERNYFAIGWRNDSGGYELRNSFIKMCTAPKDVTVVGDLCCCTFLVFEGFFDFLSAVVMGWFRPMEMNAVVLNSTALINRALPVLNNASRIICLLDNDESGRRATETIISAKQEAEDHSYLYSGHVDLNDFCTAIHK